MAFKVSGMNDLLVRQLFERDASRGLAQAMVSSFSSINLSLAKRLVTLSKAMRPLIDSGSF